MFKVKMFIGTVNVNSLDGTGAVHGAAVTVLECNGHKKQITFTGEGVYGFTCGLITLTEAFNQIRSESQVILYTEENYFKNAIELAETWKENGWMLKNGSKVKNQSLLVKLYMATHREDIKAIQIVVLKKGALKGYSDLAKTCVEKEQGVEQEGCAF